MKVVILTSSRQGTASHHLPVLVKIPGISIVVIHSIGIRKRFLRHARRKLQKILRIGIGGALNGFRMRKWYQIETGDISELCLRFGVPLMNVPSLNDPATVEAFRRTNADIGVSLGNGYIPRKIHQVPKLGMINIHHEILPEYQNAQSVIWQLYNGSKITGYTVHRIDEKIDTGAIIYQEKIPISFKDRLSDTVRSTYLSLLDAPAAGLAKVLTDLDGYLITARSQSSGRRYTTPTLSQFRRITQNHDRLKNS